MAAAVINAVRGTEGQPAASIDTLVREGAITYIPFPPALAGRYQNYTQADLAKLRAAGYREPTVELAEGVRRYVEWMMARERA
jgi:ADP-L-glycero-D-manno-heptose 6-epimerase